MVFTAIVYSLFQSIPETREGEVQAIQFNQTALSSGADTEWYVPNPAEIATIWGTLSGKKFRITRITARLVGYTGTTTLYARYYGSSILTAHYDERRIAVEGETVELPISDNIHVMKTLPIYFVDVITPSTTAGDTISFTVYVEVVE